MRRHEHITAFYIETLLLIVVFVSIILVLTGVFGLSRRRRGKAFDQRRHALAERG